MISTFAAANRENISSHPIFHRLPYFYPYTSPNQNPIPFPQQSPPDDLPSDNNSIILPNLCARIDQPRPLTVLFCLLINHSLMSMATGVHLYGNPCRSCAAAWCCCSVCCGTSTIMAPSSTMHSSEQ